MSPSSPDIRKLFINTPEGEIPAEIAVSSTITDQLCAVCQGTRNSLTTRLWQAEILHIAPQEPEDAPYYLPEEPEVAHLAEAVRAQLELNGFGKAVCLACQEDLYRPGQTTYRKPTPQTEKNEL